MTDEEFEQAALACKTDDDLWRLAFRQAYERAPDAPPVLAWAMEASRIRGELDDTVDYDVIEGQG